MYILFSKENKSIQLKMTIFAPARLEQLIVTWARVSLADYYSEELTLLFKVLDLDLFLFCFTSFLPTPIIVNCMCLNTYFDFVFVFWQNIMNSTVLNSSASITAMKSFNSYLMTGFLNK